METKTVRKIKIFRTDSGELENYRMKEICKTSGIIHQAALAYSPEENGLSERSTGTVCSKARYMLFETKCPQTLWAEACETAGIVANQSSHSGLDGNIPEEVWSRKLLN